MGFLQNVVNAVEQAASAFVDTVSGNGSSAEDPGSTIDTTSASEQYNLNRMALTLAPSRDHGS